MTITALFLAATLTSPSVPPVILACAVPSTMCATLEIDCTQAGVDPDRCLAFAQAVCPTDRCLACDRAVTACEDSGGDCSQLAKHCTAALEGCDCEASCEATNTLDLDHLFAVCFAWPMALGDDCEQPSTGQCFAALAWEGCNLDTCQYSACMADIEAAGVCDDTMPDSCKPVQACVEAEQTAT